VPPAAWRFLSCTWSRSSLRASKAKSKTYRFHRIGTFVWAAQRSSCLGWLPCWSRLPCVGARAAGRLPRRVWRRAGVHRAGHVRDVPLAHGQAAAAVRRAGAAARRDRGRAAGAAVDDPGAACGLRPRARTHSPDLVPASVLACRAGRAIARPSISHKDGLSDVPGSSARAAARGALAGFCGRRQWTLTL